MATLRRLLAATLLLPASVAAQQAPPAHGSAAISAQDVQARIAFLASDALRGRNTPSPGLDAAADYAAAEFGRFRLQAAGDNGGFIQRYEFRAAKLDAAAAAFRIGTTAGAYSRDFFMVPGPVDSIAQPALYVGTAKPGMTAPPEVAGRIMVAALPGAIDQAWQSAIEGALLAAMSGRAAAVVVVLDSAFPAPMMTMLANLTAQQSAPIPLVGVTHQAVAPAFTAAGLDLAQLRASEPAAPVAITAPVLVRSASGRAPSSVPNVVAVLPGSDPVLKHEYVVFSAHIDHVGVGAPDATGDSIYNGADDDASGTTAVLEVAQAFAARGTAPKRSLVFLLVSGEEKGLLGSQHFAEHPTVPLEKVVANINFDMIGRNHPDTVVAIGMEYTGLGEVVQQVASRQREDLRLVVAPDLWPEENLFMRSDHYSFAAKGIPAIFFTTGLHGDYHKPSDEPETIDSDKLARISRLVYHLGEAVADAPEKPQWTEQGKAVLKLK